MRKLTPTLPPGLAGTGGTVTGGEKPEERRGLAVLFLAAAALAPLAVVAYTFLRPAETSLPKTKLLLLAAQYAFTLPLAGWLGWRHRGTGAGKPVEGKRAGPGFLVLALVYLAGTVPVAAYLGPGFYQADEGTYLFQARCAANGRLSVALPPVPEHLLDYEYHVIANGKWFGKYPYGWPAVLALGTLANLEWLVNPLLGLALLGAAYGAAKWFTPPGSQNWGVAFLALSPCFTLNCVGFMSHVMCGLPLAGAVLCYMRQERSKKPLRWLFGLAACLGVSVVVRPFTAVCAGPVLVVAVLWRLVRQREMRQAAAFLGFGLLAAAVSSGSLAVTNRNLTGSYLVSPYSVGQRVSGVPEISLEIHSLLETLTRVTPVRLADTGITAFPFIFLLAGYALIRRPRGRDWLLAALFAALVAGYLVDIENSDSPVGERFYFETFFALALLAGIGWARLERDCDWSRWFRNALAAALCVVSLASMAVGTKWLVDTRYRVRRMVLAAERPPFDNGVVYVMPAGDLIPEHYNLNRPLGARSIRPQSDAQSVTGNRRGCESAAGGLRGAVLR